jgi:cytochrome c oxidase cbb3-type subunit 1
VKLTGGPVPVWLPTISIASSIMMIVPIVTITTNLVTTMRGKLDMVAYSPTVRFTFFGAISFAVATAIGVVGSLRSFDRAFHFSQYQEAHQHLMLYAFFSMIMFGAIYYIAPRLVGCEWLSRTLMKLHFLGSAYGGGLVIISLLLSGLAFGFTIANPESTYAQAIQVAQIYSVGRIVGLILLTIGHTFFGLHFLLMLLRIGQPGGQPTLLATPGEDHH